MFKKKGIIWIIVILLVAVGGYFIFGNKKTKTQYTTETAVREDLAQTVSVTGNVISESQTDLSFKVSGKIILMNVDKGDKVFKGQRLAEIDRGTLNAELDKAKLEIKYQKKTLDNMEKRNETYNFAQKEAQRAAVKKAEAARDAVLDQIKDTVIYASQDGVVTKRNLSLGENATAGVSVITLAGESDLEIEAKVPESDIIKVALGQKAVTTFDALSSSEEIETEVTRIDPASTVIQDVVYYLVRLKFPQQDVRIKNGMSSDMDIKTAERKNVLVIPLRAVKTEGTTKYVEILGEDGISVRRANVEVGLEGDDGRVEIISGINAGDKVITLAKAV